MKPPILVIEDDKKTSDLVRLYLENDDFQVLTARTGRYALKVMRSEVLSLIILDLMLPEVNGLDICAIAHAETDTPIIILTAKATEDDKLLGLELGADDYITKPFSPRELVARVKAVLRRVSNENKPQEDEVIQVENISINVMRHEVFLNDLPVELTPREFKLLEVLARNPGRVYSRQNLLERVLGYDYDGLDRTIDAHVKNLRRKIEPNPSEPIFIHTVYGIGYKFTGR